MYEFSSRYSSSFAHPTSVLVSTFIFVSLFVLLLLLLYSISYSNTILFRNLVLLSLLFLLYKNKTTIIIKSNELNYNKINTQPPFSFRFFSFLSPLSFSSRAFFFFCPVSLSERTRHGDTNDYFFTTAIIIHSLYIFIPIVS